MDYPWNSAKLEKEWPDLEACVGTLLHFQNNDELGVLGTFSVLAAGNGQVLGVSATHSFDELRKHEGNRGFVFQPPNIEPTSSKLDKLLPLKNVKAMLRFGEEIILASVPLVWTNNDHDTAVFIAENEAFPRKFPRIEIDLDFPKIGEEIVIVGYVHTIGEAKKGRFSLERAIALRREKISDVHFAKNRLGKVLTFETTIPVEPGLSGSPVFRFSESEKPMAAIGVVSSDFSEPSAFSSHTISGMSTCSMMWPSLSLPTNVFVKEAGKSISHFIELIRVC